jgi:hypothetical protein
VHVRNRRDHRWHAGRLHPQEPEDRVREHRGPADRRDAELRVRGGSDRIVDLRDHLADAELLHRDLRGHDVPVVALGEGQEDVRALSAGSSQDVLVGAVPADRLALEIVGQPVERLRHGVDDDHLVPGRIKGLGERGADTAAADDDDLHGISGGIGSRTTQTSQGACLST